MTRTSLEHFNCSLARTADIIGDKWMLLIIRDAFYGVQSFSEFQERLGLAKTVLSSRLQALVDGDILDKLQTRPGVDRHIYKLTPRGRDLFPVIVSLVQWGDKWIFGAGKEPVSIMDKDQKAPIQAVGVQARNGNFLQPGDIAFAPGAGADDSTHALFASYHAKRAAGEES
ncbi:winged helix-turn-helix transcriptional regulator [Alterisphingorhabdus coralli]|uniref:Helix-turn-helix domain-containing protein n=1 Tax=Alterisphingorhabdus coralli TaxID=3071408 RepID=A0AA97F8M3_9SPHN|nr:helix-turn-helix domain-containing protein [Parasphingorhabdus sp. SCSIO 66989]WOE76389.1 helix-turn-helix domain-containing protein [Parasphingorhabdus sp. SCSIO 66989]